MPKIFEINGKPNRSDTNSLFFRLPFETLKEIKYSPSLDPDFLAALSNAARGKFDRLEATLEASKSDQEKLKRLLLQRADVITRSGLQVKGTTLLECAFGEFDTRMVAMIKPYFAEIEGGDQALESQLERCREALQRQKSYDLTWLIDIIKKSSLKDIQAALAKKYEACNEELRNAFIKFRSDTTLKVLTKPGMHDNPEILVQAFKLLFQDEWKNLVMQDENGERDYAKCDLIWNQVIGWLMRNLVGVHRFAFAQNSFGEDTNEDPLNRRVYEYCKLNSFPNTSPDDTASFSGLGFDFGILEGEKRGFGGWPAALAFDRYKTRVEQQLQTCITYATGPTLKPSV